MIHLNDAYEATIWVGNLGVAPTFNLAYRSIAQYTLYLLVTINKLANLLKETLKQLRKCNKFKKLHTTPGHNILAKLKFPLPLSSLLFLLHWGTLRQRQH